MNCIKFINDQPEIPGNGKSLKWNWINGIPGKSLKWTWINLKNVFKCPYYRYS